MLDAISFIIKPIILLILLTSFYVDILLCIGIWMQQSTSTPHSCVENPAQVFNQQQLDYLRAHPELKQILGQFLNSCISQDPKSIEDHIQNYFKQFKSNRLMPKYKPLVISGCSGVGKGTLIKYLLERYPELFELSVSITTRKPRPGQVHGREYYFVDKEQFKKEIDENLFAEHCEVHGNYYGTHQRKLDDIVNRGKICLLDIDLQGGQKIFAKRPDCYFLFIDGPSLEIIEERLRNRKTESEEAIAKRMKNARGELQVVKGLNYYQHLLNEDLDRAKSDLISYMNKKYGLSLTA